jgi:hypothetical protein
VLGARGLERPVCHHCFDALRGQLVHHALRVRPARGVELPVPLCHPVLPVAAGGVA